MQHTLAEEGWCHTRLSRGPEGLHVQLSSSTLEDALQGAQPGLWVNALGVVSTPTTLLYRPQAMASVTADAALMSILEDLSELPASPPRSPEPEPEPESDAEPGGRAVGVLMGRGASLLRPASPPAAARTPRPARQQHPHRLSLRGSSIAALEGFLARYEPSPAGVACVCCHTDPVDGDLMLQPCSHACLCRDCLRSLAAQRRPKCPSCRSRVRRLEHRFVQGVPLDGATLASPGS